MNYLKRTWAEIDISALLHNFSVIKENAGCALSAVVKADAYGHGASVVAPILDNAGADSFAVSNIEEAIELRKNGIKKPILVLGYTPASYTKTLIKNKITQTVYSLDYAKELSENTKKKTLQCHIKIDTGMSRLGFDCRDDSLAGLDDIKASISLPNLTFSGIFTHFATADGDGDDGFTNAQYNRFCAVCDKLKKDGIEFKYTHCCNSAGILLHTDKHSNLSRPGIILYGLTPSASLAPNIPLLPVMSFKSTVSFVKTIKAGDSVSYGRNFKAGRDMTVATVAAGYADGYPRLLSSKGYVLIKGKKCAVLGNVCMDQMVVDVTDVSDVSPGDEVTLFGKDLPVEDCAALCGTINYELICGVSRRVPRVYIKDGKEIKVVDYILDK